MYEHGSLSLSAVLELEEIDKAMQESPIGVLY